MYVMYVYLRIGVSGRTKSMRRYIRDRKALRLEYDSASPSYLGLTRIAANSLLCIHLIYFVSCVTTAQHVLIRLLVQCQWNKTTKNVDEQEQPPSASVL